MFAILRLVEPSGEIKTFYSAPTSAWQLASAWDYFCIVLLGCSIIILWHSSGQNWTGSKCIFENEPFGIKSKTNFTSFHMNTMTLYDSLNWHELTELMNALLVQDPGHVGPSWPSWRNLSSEGLQASMTAPLSDWFEGTLSKECADKASQACDLFLISSTAWECVQGKSPPAWLLASVTAEEAACFRLSSMHSPLQPRPSDFHEASQSISKHLVSATSYFHPFVCISELLACNTFVISTCITHGSYD